MPINYQLWISQTGGADSRSAELKQVDKWLKRYLACRTINNHAMLCHAYNQWRRQYPHIPVHQVHHELEELISTPSMSAMVEQIEVGPDLFLFKTIHDETVQPRLLISSHGRTRYFGQHFTPRSNLHFFVREGFILKDPGISKVINGRCCEQETVAIGSDCTDYHLDKYQDPSGSTGGETYQTIVNDLTKLVKFQIGVQKGQFSPPAAINGANYFNANDLYDVCTIRRHGSMPLSQLLNILEEHRYHYTDVYCSFCRASWMPWSTSPSASAPLAKVEGRCPTYLIKDF